MRKNTQIAKKIAITGSEGMLGHDLKKVFGSDKKYALVLYTKKTLDITDEKKVLQKLEKDKPDIIINAAAFTAVDDCEDKKHKKACIAVNGVGPKNVAKAAKKIGAILVQISTDYVFDGKKKSGYTERSRVGPINTYGKSKLMGEETVKKECTKFYIVRTSWLFGKNGPNFVETMLMLGKKHPELKVVHDQHGKPTWTYDLALHIKKLLERNKAFGVYHCTNEGETTWYNFTREILKQAKIKTPVKPCTSEEFPRPAKRPEYSTLLNTKFSRMPHWKKALTGYLKDRKKKA
ncbi:dTDP-4-dehydrorhamnose reductase [Patescibacteria group bacterium]|nr:dTDP-4-dehydrorhamnose reductase [Patescibacteria group bacterium]